MFLFFPEFNPISLLFLSFLFPFLISLLCILFTPHLQDSQQSVPPGEHGSSEWHLFSSLWDDGGRQDDSPWFVQSVAKTCYLITGKGISSNLSYLCSHQVSLTILWIYVTPLFTKPAWSACRDFSPSCMKTGKKSLFFDNLSPTVSTSNLLLQSKIFSLQCCSNFAASTFWEMSDCRFSRISTRSRGCLKK